MSQPTVVDMTFRTLSQKGRGNPFDPANYGEIVKPGELVDIVELTPLTLADRRIYNLLIANAWERIGEPIIHRIAKSRLKGTHQLSPSAKTAKATSAVSSSLAQAMKALKRTAFFITESRKS
jgi:hypothetical protein